jgi:hypothetical protein
MADTARRPGGLYSRAEALPPIRASLYLGDERERESMPADELNEPVPPAADPANVDEFGDELGEGEWSEEDADDQREGRMRAVVAVIILVIVVILVLLLLRMCGTTTKSGSAGDKTIVGVPPQVRVENVVSVWLKPQASMKQVLSDARVRATSTRSMGEGLYFVFLPDGEDPDSAVRRLKADADVNDAGFVYDQLKVAPASSTP